jgi:hypothetical protein
MDSVQGRVVYAFFKTASTVGKDSVTVGAIHTTCEEEMKLDIKENSVSRILHDMKIVTERKRVGTSRVNAVKWNDNLMRKLYKKYLNDLTPIDINNMDSEESQFMEMLGFDKFLKT